MRSSSLALIALLGALAPAAAQAPPAGSKPVPPPVVTAPPPPPAPPPPRQVEAGPLFDQAEAAQRCPQVCPAGTTWNGGWRTTKAGIMSVCDCALPPPPPPPPPTTPALPIRVVEAGPLSGDAAAKATCPRVCAAPARWAGSWRTTVPGKMSTCDCIEPAPPPAPPLLTTVTAPPIKSAKGAAKTCTKACGPAATWTGDWKSTKKGKAAQCTCAAPVPPASAPPPPPPPPAPPARTR